MNGLITKIEAQKRNKNRVNVYIDDVYSFACSAELVYRYGLKNGKEINIADFEAILEEDDYIKGKNEALRIIEKNYKTEKKVAEKLIYKGYQYKTVERILSFLKEYTFLDDEKQAEIYIQSKVKGEGRKKILSTMIGKGFSAELVKEKISGLDKEIEKEAALKLAEKKYALLVKSEQDPRKLYKKLGDFLLRKGYNFEEVKAVLKIVLRSEIEEE